MWGWAVGMGCGDGLWGWAGTNATPAAFNLGLCRLRGILSPPSATTTFRRRAVLLAGTMVLQAEQFYFAAKKIRSDAASWRQRLRRRAILFCDTMVLQRFLILSPELAITAAQPVISGIFVQRFLISSQELAITAAQPVISWTFVQRFLISGPDLRIDAAKRSKQGNPSSPRGEALCRGRGMPDGQGLRTA